MKHKNSDLPAYWILTLLGVILVAAMVLYIKLFFDSTRKPMDQIIDSTAAMANELLEREITMYEGEEIKGSEVVNYIKRNLGDYTSAETAPIFVRVKTAFAGTAYTNDYTNKAHIRDIRNVSAMEYFIKPTAYFSCEIIRSENKVVLGVSFIQRDGL